MLNKVTLIGRLGRDPETRYLSNNEPVCNFSMATDERWNDKDGNKQQRTEWHNIVLYRRLAEIAQQYLKKGSLVYIEGKIQSRKYTGKDGIERSAFDIVANEMKMLGGKNESSGGGSSGYNPFPDDTYAESRNDTAGENAPSAPPAAPKPPSRKNAPAAPAPETIDDLDGDVPF